MTARSSRYGTLCSSVSRYTYFVGACLRGLFVVLPAWGYWPVLRRFHHHEIQFPDCFVLWRLVAQTCATFFVYGAVVASAVVHHCHEAIAPAFVGILCVSLKLHLYAFPSVGNGQPPCAIPRDPVPGHRSTSNAGWHIPLRKTPECRCGTAAETQPCR